MKIVYSKKFKKSLKRILSQYPFLENKVFDMIDDFNKELFESKFFRKRFYYKWREISELEFWWDWRMLCEVIIIDDTIYLLNIWSHSSLELSSKKKLRI